MHISIVRSAFYEELLEQMEERARAALIAEGVPAQAISVSTVPGAFEIPLACKREIETGAQGVIALGIIIEGETHHAAEIARACTDGIMQVQIEYGIPIAHEVLYVRERAQAEARVGKGAEAARTLLRMLEER